MKKCPNCDAELSDGATFCPICNRVIETSQEQRKYDSYYDDVTVIDAKEVEKKKLGSGAALKIGLVVGGLVVVLAGCITVLCLL